MKKLKQLFCLLNRSIFFSLIFFLFSYQQAEAMSQGMHTIAIGPQKFQENQTPTNIYIPLISKDYTPPHILRSPFSLAIPAIHQVTIYQAISSNGSSLVTFPSLLDAFIETGATSTRIEVNWSVIEPEKPDNIDEPNYNWGFYDQKLGLIADHGIQMIVNIMASNAWAADPPCGLFKEDGLDHFDRFVADLVTRYKAPPYNVRFWEIINEPDGIRDSAAEIGQGCWGYYGGEYQEVLSRVYTTIKSIDPYATVMHGGIAHENFPEYENPTPYYNRYFLDDVMIAGGGGYTDALNYHYFTDFRKEWERWDPDHEDRKNGWLNAPTCGNVYDGQGNEYFAGGVDVIAKGIHIRNRMAVCFGVEKPLFLTEAAKRSQDDDPESLLSMARYVPKVFARSLSIGIKSITWYAITTPNQEDGQGLLDNNFSPRPAFYAYQTMTNELKGYEFNSYLEPINLNTALEGYYFRNSSGGLKLVVWKGDYFDDPYAELILAPATQIQVVDYMGDTVIITDGGVGDMDGQANGSIKLHVDENPIYIVILNN